MRTQPLLLALLVAVALAPFGCKRKMDDVIPNSTPAASAAASTAATASAKASAPDDTAEPLATLSSARIAAPPPPPPPATGGSTATATGKGTAAGAPAPQECGAALLMKKLGKVNEAETLRIKCVEKGGKDPFSK